jgi:hypothetical protein
MEEPWICQVSQPSRFPSTVRAVIEAAGALAFVSTINPDGSPPGTGIGSAWTTAPLSRH